MIFVEWTEKNQTKHSRALRLPFELGLTDSLECSAKPRIMELRFRFGLRSASFNSGISFTLLFLKLPFQHLFVCDQIANPLHVVDLALVLRTVTWPQVISLMGSDAFLCIASNFAQVLRPTG